MCVCISVCVSLQACSVCVCISVCVSLYACFVYVCVHVCVWLSLHVRMGVGVCVCLCHLHSISSDCLPAYLCVCVHDSGVITEHTFCVSML